MNSEDYRQILNKEHELKELNKKDFDNTLMHFAELYYKEKSLVYFSGKALQGLLSNPKYFSCDENMIREDLITERALKLANDMIKKI